MLTLNSQIAGIWSRIGAAVLDYLLVCIAVAIVMFFWGMLDAGGIGHTSEIVWRGRGILLAIFLDLIYSCVTMSGEKQSTLGQRVLHIKVIRYSDSPNIRALAMYRVL